MQAAHQTDQRDWTWVNCPQSDPWDAGQHKPQVAPTHPNPRHCQKVKYKTHGNCTTPSTELLLYSATVGLLHRKYVEIFLETMSGCYVAITLAHFLPLASVFGTKIGHNQPNQTHGLTQPGSLQRNPELLCRWNITMMTMMTARPQTASSAAESRATATADGTPGAGSWSVTRGTWCHRPPLRSARGPPSPGRSWRAASAAAAAWWQVSTASSSPAQPARPRPRPASPPGRPRSTAARWGSAWLAASWSQRYPLTVWPGCSRRSTSHASYTSRVVRRRTVRSAVLPSS